MRTALAVFLVDIPAHANGAKLRPTWKNCSINVGRPLPCDGPLSCRLVFVRPGWAALDTSPQPPDLLLRSNSMANIRFADFDSEYACVGL